MKKLAFLLLSLCAALSLAGAALAAAKVTPAPDYERPGFETYLEDGRLWVFHKHAKDLKTFHERGELAKFVVRPAAGPERMTLKGPDAETLDAYLLSRPGFVTKVEEGRLWVLRDGSDELKQFVERGELAKFIVRPAAGPNGMTLRAPDAETADAYMALFR
ncbi:hypothetical protein [Geoalkalibacter sp.]|uniref:hypothetical protein n=1 Tax=Geoalkalibacter sp. TaxID=3041440 RepID=UPI00272E16D9|nr:hypothetical protein [Geoalkalibacter sp.]